jgi:hypothetical protein
LNNIPVVCQNSSVRALARIRQVPHPYVAEGKEGCLCNSASCARTYGGCACCWANMSNNHPAALPPRTGTAPLTLFCICCVRCAGLNAELMAQAAALPATAVYRTSVESACAQTLSVLDSDVTDRKSKGADLYRQTEDGKRPRLECGAAACGDLGGALCARPGRSILIRRGLPAVMQLRAAPR